MTKAPPKFKVGDEVVTTTLKPFAGYEIGSRAVVIWANGYYYDLQMRSSGNRQGCGEHNIELEHVYNSPLGQALR